MRTEWRYRHADDGTVVSSRLHCTIVMQITGEADNYRPDINLWMGLHVSCIQRSERRKLKGTYCRGRVIRSLMKGHRKIGIDESFSTLDTLNHLQLPFSLRTVIQWEKSLSLNCNLFNQVCVCFSIPLLNSIKSL